MTKSNGNGNGDGNYNPDVEFEYWKDTNIWIEKDSDGNEKIAYAEDVLEELENDDQSDSNSDN